MILNNPTGITKFLGSIVGFIMFVCFLLGIIGIFLEALFPEWWHRHTKKDK